MFYAGASENVNYAMHTLCALLVLYGVFKNVHIARLPVGHTHIDIDGRHAIFAQHFNGTKSTAGRVQNGILTPNEFDREIVVPYQKDRVKVIRKYGLLSFSKSVDGWIAISNYGTPTKHSAHAKKQGTRDPEAHYFHYFKDPISNDARMRYKYRENMAESQWLPAAGKPAIVALQPECLEAAWDLFKQDIPMRNLEDWPQKASVEANILSNNLLSPLQKSEWQQWFSEFPVTLDQVPEEERFTWCIPKIAKEKLAVRKAKEGNTSRLIPTVVSSMDLPFNHEVIVHAGYTKKDLKRDRVTREDWNTRKEQARSEGEAIAAMMSLRLNRKR